MAGYTRNPQTVPDDSPGGSTTRQAVADMNSVAINDLFTGLNAHSNSELGRTHTEIDAAIDNISTGIVPEVEELRDECIVQADRSTTEADKSAQSAIGADASAQKASSYEATYDTVTDLTVVNGESSLTKACFVKENLRGGSFVYDTTRQLENDGGIVFNGWVRQYSGAVYATWFGATHLGDSTINTNALLNAISSIRDNEKTILNAIGGVDIQVYTSGTVAFPKGIYPLDYDVLEITQDFGLTIKGEGSRKIANYQYGATVLRFAGLSSGFGIRVAYNGARNFHLEDLDVTYEGDTFTGDLIDNEGGAGFTVTRCYLGTDGLSSATRNTSANSIIRTSYEEAMRIENSVLNGAKYGWWADSARLTYGNTFGGSGTVFDQSVFQDFEYDHVFHLGATKNKLNVLFSGTAFNPIAISPVGHAISMSNVDGLRLENVHFAASVSSFPANGWLALSNVTGSVENCVFGSLADFGTIRGNIDISNNLISCTNGPKLDGGVITGSGNEFRGAVHGWDITSAPTTALSLNLGPDFFNSDVGFSFKSTASSALVSGVINYDPAQDLTDGKYSNVNGALRINGVDIATVSIQSTPYTMTQTEIGKVFDLGVGSSVFNLPVASAGAKILLHKTSNAAVTIATSGGNNIYGFSVAVYTSLVSGATRGAVVLRSLSPANGWAVESIHGDWSGV